MKSLAGDQAKTVCGNLQLCEGLKVSIDGATHAVGQQRVERMRARRVEEESEVEAVAEEQDEEGAEVAGLIGN